MSRLVVETALSPEECFRRIADATDSWDPLRRWDSSDNLMAQLAPPRFKLTTQSYFRNRGFKLVFYGRLSQEAGRTMIYGRVGLSLASLLFFSLAIAFPAALQFNVLGWVPGLNRFEVLLPVYWALVFLLFRMIGAWDSGGPADRYSIFLAEALWSPDSAGPVSRSRMN